MPPELFIQTLGDREMSVIARIGVPAEEFPLDRALLAGSDARVQLERVIPLGEAAIPYLWISEDTVEVIRAGTDADPSVHAAEVIDEVDGRALVRIEWEAKPDGFLSVLAESDAVLLDGVGSGGFWEFELRFPDHEAMSRFYRQCTERGISVNLERVQSRSGGGNLGLGYSLTDLQRETLLTAFDEGYFAVPRGVTLVELADRLGVSDSAVSQRLRRGIGKLLGATLGSDGRPDEPGEPSKPDAAE